MLVFGLVVISVFEIALGGLRAWVLAHTTNRIDVELGARLFRRLANLPLGYFGVRRVGDSLARARELENKVGRSLPFKFIVLNPGSSIAGDKPVGRRNSRLRSWRDATRRDAKSSLSPRYVLLPVRNTVRYRSHSSAPDNWKPCCGVRSETGAGWRPLDLRSYRAASQAPITLRVSKAGRIISR